LGDVDEGRAADVEMVFEVIGRAFVNGEVAMSESCARDDLGRIMERKRRVEESVSDVGQRQNPVGRRRRLESMMLMMTMMIMTKIPTKQQRRTDY
jgi:hypothetical protein